MRLDQFIPVLDPGDASSNHTLQVQRLLHDLGVDSDVYTEQTHPTLAGLARPYGEHPGGPVLYQMAIGSRMADALIDADRRVVPLAVNHHNFTPPEFFEAWDPPLVHGTAWGRRQLERMAGRADLAVAVSTFNTADLVEFGYRRIEVVPLLVDLTAFEREVDDEALARLREDKGDGADWLFVGRLVPNKCQHDVLKAFATWRRNGGIGRLFLVGGASSVRYEQALRRYAVALGIDAGVHLTGAVPSGVLAAHYANADVFVCLSAHEGFCVPLLEAMHHGVPVVAHGVAAVPETLGDGGLCLPDKSPDVVATAVERVVRDGALRAALVAAGRRRLDHFALSRTRQRMADVLLGWLADLGSDAS